LPIDFGNVTITDLYQEFERPLRRYAMSLARDSSRADDLVQETFIRAMAYLELLQRLNRHQRQAWLYRVLKNLFLDQQRARQREQTLLEQLAHLTLVDSGPPVDATLYGWLDLLPERYRELLQKRYFLGMTSEEIGRELGVPAATVRSRLHLAIKWLREHQSEFI
jgi:RNA polymerase sigma-70 factor (ECF subfamily)